MALIRSNRQAIAQLATLAEDRRSLAQQLISSQESLLRRLSRDLHDEFGQILTAIGALLRRAERHTAEEQLQEEVREVRGIVQDALEKVRSLSQSLQPVILEEQGLLAALGWHVETFSRHTGLPVQATLPQTELPLPVEQAVHLYRIVQEALSNVVRHAGATQVRLILEVMPGQLQLQVEDNGKGLPPQAPSGVGLTAMRERAALLGGTLEMVRAGSGTGVCVQLRMPGRPRGRG